MLFIRYKVFGFVACCLTISFFCSGQEIEPVSDTTKTKKKFQFFKGKRKKKKIISDSLSLSNAYLDSSLVSLDTLQGLNKKQIRELNQKVAIRKKLKSPSKAALLSGILPGLGQIYNRKIWKVPLVAAGFGYFGYTINLFNERFIESRDNLFFSTDGDPNTEVDIRFIFFTDENLRRRRDTARRDRDYNIILGTLFYGLVVADAAVDGHLNKFDVTDDLSMVVKPKLIPLNSLDNSDILFPSGNFAPGLSVVLTLK